MRQKVISAAIGFSLLLLGPAVWAGPVFITGHDPDFHSQIPSDPGARNLFQIGLDFATGNTTSTAGTKFLWVESNGPIPGGHLFGRNGLTNSTNGLGLTQGTHFDHVDAAGLASVNFSNYTAIAIASAFGGMLTAAELDGLIARKADIETFINAGGGLFASSECITGCGAGLLTGATGSPYGYLPIAVTAIGAGAPFTVTSFGASLGLVNGDVTSPTHNSFASAGGLNIVDTNIIGKPTTLAGNVTIGGGGFVPAPEPTTLMLLGLGLVGLGFGKRRSS